MPVDVMANTLVSLTDVWTHFTNVNWTVQVLTLAIIFYGLTRWLCMPYIRDFWTAENCHVKLENSNPLKAGDQVVFTISGFLRASEANLDYDEIDLRTQRFFNHLIVRVVLNDNPVPVEKLFHEMEPGLIRVIFTADKSGVYQMLLRYNGFLLSGSPVEIEIPPDALCPDKTIIQIPARPIILTDGIPQMVTIFPRDRSGQPCNNSGVQLDKFDFHASTEKSCCNAYLCRKMCELIGGFWNEGLDASFSYRCRDVASYRKDTPVVQMSLRSNRSPNSYGIFEGQISYGCQLIDCFPVVSLTQEEYEKLEPTMTEPKHTDVVQLKGELVQPLVSKNGHLNDPKGFLDWYRHVEPDSATASEPREVHLNVSLKFICVKEVVWTVLLARSALFSIQGSTKIEAVPETEQRLKYIVKILDDYGNQVCVKMLASSTRMLMALFLKFRSCGENTERNFTEKCDGLLQALRSHCLSMFSNTRGSPQVITVSRPDILRTSLEATRQFEKLHWYSPIIVSFLREPGRVENSWLEWAEQILDTVLENNPNGLFCKISERSGFIHPNTLRNYRRWTSQYYELVGKLVGKYLVERAMNPTSLQYRLRVRFSRSFLLQLIGSAPTASTLESDMPELYEATLSTLTKTNFAAGNLSFHIPVYDSFGKLDHMVPLIDNGENIMVTNENADLYLNALAHYHLSYKVRREMTSFRAGFISVVPEDLLLNFDENELELLLCGWSKLKVQDLTKNFTTVGESWHPEFPRVLRWLWNSLDAMTEVEQAQFLQFATGSSVLPLGGFSQLKPNIVISMTCVYGQQPVADPTNHKICFSDHPNYDSFHKALLAAISRSSCCQDRPRHLECSHHDKENAQDKDTTPMNNNSNVNNVEEMPSACNAHASQ